MYKILASMAATFLLSLALTPLIRGLALKIGAVDNPNARRVNKVPMPTMGGLAIFIAFNIANFALLRNQYPSDQIWPLFAAEVLIILTGIIDDIYELKPRQKMFGILLASLVVYFAAGIRMTTLTIRRMILKITSVVKAEIILKLPQIIRTIPKTNIIFERDRSFSG